MILRPLKRVCFSGIKSDRRQNSSGRMYLARVLGESGEILEIILAGDRVLWDEGGGPR
jgi:hypothetical protein